MMQGLRPREPPEDIPFEEMLQRRWRDAFAENRGEGPFKTLEVVSWGLAWEDTVAAVAEAVGREEGEVEKAMLAVPNDAVPRSIRTSVGNLYGDSPPRWFRRKHAG